MSSHHERETAAFWATFRGLLLLVPPDTVWLTQAGKRRLPSRCSAVGLTMPYSMPLAEFKALHTELLRREQARQLRERPLDRNKLGERNWQFLRDFLPAHEQYRLQSTPALVLITGQPSSSKSCSNQSTPTLAPPSA